MNRSRGEKALKIHEKIQKKMQSIQSNPRQKKKAKGITNFKLYYKAMVTKTA